MVRQLELPVEIIRNAPPPTLLPLTNFVRHLLVSAPYLRDSDLSILYLDVIVCLQFLKQVFDGGAEASMALSLFSDVKIQDREPNERDAIARKAGFESYRDFISRIEANKDYGFVDFPTVVDAYKETVGEARRSDSLSPR